MRLEDLGFNKRHEEYLTGNDLTGFETGRIIAEHKERYIVRTVDGELEAEITGNMRFTSKSREDFPAVGDWVALTAYDNYLAVIHHILPRSSIIKRQAVGRFGEIQIIAANIDYAFIVQAVDQDFSINRLERYLTICNSSRIKPVIVLSKTDLIDEPVIKEVTDSVMARIRNIPVVAISNKTQTGYAAIIELIEKGKTYCLLGSSGAGKSTLLNNLAGKTIMRTDEISGSTKKGKHITSHRELIILENGGILIDNPGMREVGIADTTGGLEITFDIIARYSQACRFKDCTHTSEAGCSVLEAVEKGEIPKASYENYLKMKKEKDHFESSVEERRKKERIFGRILKSYKKDMKNNSF
jgi:ribosome biogenesis GTPase